jgi:hypothetical protein
MQKYGCPGRLDMPDLRFREKCIQCNLIGSNQ